MHSGLKFQLAINTFAAYRQNQLAIPPQIRFRGTQGLGRPAPALGIALVHASQIAGPESRFIAPSSSTNFQHDTALIAGV